MKRAVFNHNKDVKLDVVSDPVPEINEVVVQVKACAICGV